MSGLFDDLLQPLGDKDRDAVVAAWAALEYGKDPVAEASVPGLRNPELRRLLEQMLGRAGRTLVQTGPYTWTSGYRDDVAAELMANGWGTLPPLARAALTLVLVHSVAIPRAKGRLSGDGWQSELPTTPTDLRRLSQVGGGQLTSALRWLLSAGLIRRVRGDDPGTAGASYAPGPALARLTPAARQRLQENLILAAGPDSPLATAITIRRNPGAARTAHAPQGAHE